MEGKARTVDSGGHELYPALPFIVSNVIFQCHYSGRLRESEGF